VADQDERAGLLASRRALDDDGQLGPAHLAHVELDGLGGLSGLRFVWLHDDGRSGPAVLHYHRAFRCRPFRHASAADQQHNSHTHRKTPEHCTTPPLEVQPPRRRWVF